MSKPLGELYKKGAAPLEVAETFCKAGEGEHREHWKAHQARMRASMGLPPLDHGDRDYLAEAYRIAAGESTIVPERAHLKALVGEIGILRTELHLVAEANAAMKKALGGKSREEEHEAL